MGLLRPIWGGALLLLLLCDQLIRAPLFFSSLLHDLTFWRYGFQEEIHETSMFYVHHIRAGQGQKMMFLHEEGGDRYSYVDVAPALVDYGTVDIVELGNHGSSQSLKDGFYYIMEDSLKILIENEESVVLVASGLSCRLALDMARIYPSKITSLVLISPIGIDLKVHNWPMLLPIVEEDMGEKLRQIHQTSFPDFLVHAHHKRFSFHPRDQQEVITLSNFSDVLPLVHQPIHLLIGSKDTISERESLEKLPQVHVHKVGACGYAAQYGCASSIVEKLIKIVKP